MEPEHENKLVDLIISCAVRGLSLCGNMQYGGSPDHIHVNDAMGFMEEIGIMRTKNLEKAVEKEAR